MHIAQIVARYYPNIGGVEKFVQSISEEMITRGHNLEILTSDGAAAETVEMVNGVSIRRFQSTGPFGYSNLLYDYLIKNNNKYDIIHAHSFHTLLPFLACRVKKHRGDHIGLVIMGHYHGRGGTFFTNILLGTARPWFAKAYSEAQLVLCHTIHEKTMIKRHFNVNESQICVVNSGVALREIHTAEAYHAGYGKVLLIVSRLEAYKNIDLAVRAMVDLDDSIRLMIIGDGPERVQLEGLVQRLGLVHRVKLLGTLKTEDVHRWYKTCSLVLNMSDLEAFGLTLIEGLAAGRPVLVNDRTALTELASRFDGVTAVDALGMTPRTLAEAIMERMSAPFAAPDLEEYSWGAVVDKVLECYRTIVEPLPRSLYAS